MIADYNLTNYLSGETYKNRYSKSFSFKKVSDFMGQHIYALEHEDLRYCRYGGLEGQKEIDRHNLDMIDPAGGPYLKINWFKIDGMIVNNIRLTDDGRVLMLCNY